MSLVFRGCSEEIPITRRPLCSKVSSMDDTIPNGDNLASIFFYAVSDLDNISISLQLSTRAPNLSLTISPSRFFTIVSFSARSFRAKLSWTVPCGLYGFFILIPLAFGNFRHTVAEMFTTTFPIPLPYINPAIYVGFYTFGNPIVSRKPDSMSLLSIAGLASQLWYMVFWLYPGL